MTDSITTDVPAGLFKMTDLADEVRRDDIARRLNGVRWRMTVRSEYRPGTPFGFLCHAAFQDDVFFSTKLLGSWADNGKLRPFTILEAEVRPTFDAGKARWGYAVKSAKKISVPSALEISLLELRQFVSSWRNDDVSELGRLKAECLAIDPGSKPKIDEAIKLGQGDKDLFDSFYNLGRRLGESFAEHQDFVKKLQQLGARRPDMIGTVWHNAAKGAKAGGRGSEAAQRRLRGQPVSRIRAPQAISASRPASLPPLGRTDLPAMATSTLHPRDLRALVHQPAWQLMIDETGVAFGPEANRLSGSDRTLGRFVGLLMPQDAGLAPLPPRWHAVDQPIDEIDRVVQAILDAPVGIIGITVQQLPDAPGERWAFGIIRLIDLVLRLMPLAALTRLEVLIEQRDAFKGGAQWPAVAEQARLRLAEAYPERARWIEFKIRTIAKQDSPYNGYVDALAFIASGSSEHSRACLAASGLSGTCLLGGDAEFLGRALEWMDRGRTLEGHDWTALLAHPDARQPASLVDTLLERLGHAASRDPTLWRRYLDHVTGHIDSRNLDLTALGQQVIWLDRWMPADQALPPTLRLLWLTAQLARANHLGRTEQPWMDEMRVLADRLMDEDARLVCRAELNLAVTATNQYDFEAAGRALQRWNPPEAQPQGKLRGLIQKLLGTQPPVSGALAGPKATAGLRYWGQVRSSLGQHAAFTGDLASAVRFFEEALESFQQLSDPEMARREMRQTQTYRAIALMDDPAQDAATVRAAVELVTGSLPQTLEKLAGSVSSADKYAHHLALRWLVHRPDPLMAEVYIARRKAWDTAEGHPWPLIQLYRGMLLHPQNATAARELAMDGALHAFAKDSGPVVDLIGACCRAIAAHWGEPWEMPGPVLDNLAQQLPLAAPRIDLIRGALQTPREPLELLLDVLPFNFR